MLEIVFSVALDNGSPVGVLPKCERQTKPHLAISNASAIGDLGGTVPLNGFCESGLNVHHWLVSKAFAGGGYVGKRMLHVASPVRTVVRWKRVSRQLLKDLV